MMNWDRVSTCIKQQGFCVIQDWLSPAQRENLRLDFSRRLNELEFHAAGIGRAASKKQDPTIRGDLHCWWNPTDLSVVQSEVTALHETLRQQLNSRLFLGLFETEVQYALYPVGTHYARHQDQFAGGHERILSLVHYLNSDWKKEDGGELRLYPEPFQEETFEVLTPQDGNTVIFLSHLFHEVLPPRRERRSVTVWFKTVKKF